MHRVFVMPISPILWSLKLNNVIFQFTFFNTVYIAISVFKKICAYVNQDLSLLPTIALAFQTLGVVYGDMGTSPLYVFADVFSKVPIGSDDDVLGALSLVMYTIALIPLAKYVFIVLKANDNGEGNTVTDSFSQSELCTLVWFISGVL